MREQPIQLYSIGGLETLAARARRWLGSLGGARGRGHEARIVRESGLPQYALNKILAGTYDITLARIETIARHRGCNPSEIMEQIQDGKTAEGSRSIIPFQRSERLWNKLIARDPETAATALELFEYMMELDMTAALNVVAASLLRDGPRNSMPLVIEILLQEETRCTPQRRVLRARLLKKFEPRHRGKNSPEHKYRQLQ